MSKANMNRRVGLDETEVSPSEVETFAGENEVESKKLVATTVRFSAEANKAIQDLADEYGVSKSEVVRLAVAGGLEKYLGNLKYVDEQYAKIINANIMILANLMQDIKSELRRIGVNYNQQVKAMHEKKKVSIGGSLIDKPTLEDMRRKKEELMGRRHSGEEKSQVKKASQEPELDVDAIKNLIEQYEKKSEEVGDVLWHILG